MRTSGRIDPCILLCGLLYWISQGGDGMDNEMMDMFQTILTGMQDMEGRINGKMQDMEHRINSQMQDMENRINEKIDTEIQSVKVMIENDVTKRIDSLFDGYQLVHEKQWQTDKKMRELEQRLEKLEALQNVG